MVAKRLSSTTSQVRPLVLYFYPKDDTPGCTIQACDLRDSWRELQSNVELFGVSIDRLEATKNSSKNMVSPFRC